MTVFSYSHSFWPITVHMQLQVTYCNTLILMEVLDKYAFLGPNRDEIGYLKKLVILMTVALVRRFTVCSDVNESKQ